MRPLQPGTRVRTRAQRESGHTRLPGYLQCREGVIVRDLGAFPLPDDRAQALPQPGISRLYTVRFQAPWRGSVFADLFDAYLEDLP